MASSSQDGTKPVKWGEKMDQDLRSILETIQRERKALEEERETFEKEKALWTETESKLAVFQIGDVVILNVGGTHFSCSVEVLRKIPDTFFSGLVSGRWDLKCQKDGSLFIDREPTVFPLIMTYLRKYGSDFDFESWRRTMSDREKLLLKEESEFYMLPDLMNPPSPIGSILSSAEWEIASPSLKNRQLVFKTSKSQPMPYVITNEMKQSNMVIIAKLPDGSVFGGFTSIAWNFSGHWQSDNSSYLICKPSSSATLSKYPAQMLPNSFAQSTELFRFGEGFALYIDYSEAVPTLKSSTTCPSYPNLPIAISPAKETEILEIWRLY